MYLNLYIYIYYIYILSILGLPKNWVPQILVVYHISHQAAAMNSDCWALLHLSFAFIQLPRWRLLVVESFALWYPLVI